ncbi:MAG: hypothetical protein ICV86_09495, partial [Microcoleus sp. T3-bin5]|nr:hypothetical protein [Microcoleus sp. T3-bin5]
MVQQLNPPHPKNSWVEEAQKPSTGHAPPPALFQCGRPAQPAARLPGAGAGGGVSAAGAAGHGRGHGAA